MIRWPWLVSVLAGVLHGFAMAWPAFLGGDALQISGQASGFLECFSLALLAALLLRLAARDGAPKRVWLQGFWLSGLFATSAMAATWGWLYVSMHRYGGMPSWLSAAAVLLLAMALSVYFALAGGLWVALYRRWILSDRANEARYAKQAPGLTWEVLRQGLAGVALFAALWTLAELCRGQLFTGFPWGAAGYAHTDSWLSTYLPWVGVYGVGALAAGISMAAPITVAMVMARRTQAWRWLALGTALVSAVCPLALQTSGTSFSESAGRMSARLLQGNIPQDEKFIPGQGVRVAIHWYSEQLLDSTETLVVTPETAIPVLPQQLPHIYWQQLADKFAPTSNSNTSQLALLGIPLGGAGAGYSNSAVAIGSPNWLYRFDKQHLVPFGEFVPPFFQWFVRLMNMPLGDFGDFGHDRPAPSVLSWQGQRLLPQICYEDLFGEEVAQYFANAAQAPTVLVNMSNLAWFGDSTALPQHLAISRIRALEFQRPIIRATNTGTTAWVDHKGQVKAALPAFTRGALVVEFEGRTGLTPYAQWTARWGLAPLWILCVAIVLVLGFISRRSGARAL
jgi:apolipoprotein N-acyltransferase